jgi:hypothetical protein
VAANNRLKRRRDIEAGRVQAAPELVHNIRIKTIFSTRNENDSREENALPPRVCRDGNWESDERDIRDKN